MMLLKDKTSQSHARLSRGRTDTSRIQQEMQRTDMENINTSDSKRDRVKGVPTSLGTAL